MDNLALLRERAELRGELDAAADQIVELQSKISGDNSRMKDANSGQAHDEAASSEQQQVLVPRLREELVQALRDNELLRQAIGKGAIREPQGVVGHRTVSSTQLASAARSGLSAQQRWEVQDMVRRQENLRKSQADAFEEQIWTLKRERDHAQSRLDDAESRLSEATADLARLEEIRLEDNREAAADLQLWEQEKQALEARITELTAGESHAAGASLLSGRILFQAGSGELDGEKLWDPLDKHTDDVSDTSRMDKLRMKLAEVRRDTDDQVQQAASADEEAYHWFLSQSCQAAASSRETLCAEVALLHTHISTMDSDGLSGAKADALMGNLADLLKETFFQRHARPSFAAWARVAANSALVRTSFDCLFRGLGNKGATRSVMNSLAIRVREKPSLDMFKVVTGLMLRIFRRPPSRAPFLSWAFAARRNRLLWSRASKLIFSTLTVKLRRIVRAWWKFCSNRRRHFELIIRRTAVIAFRTSQIFFRLWSHEVSDASKIFVFGRRMGHTHRRSVLQQHLPLWRKHVQAIVRIKKGWHSLKARRLFRALWKAFKGWIVVAMGQALRTPDPCNQSALSSSADPSMTGTRAWFLEVRANLGRLFMYRSYRMQLRHKERCCCRKRLSGYMRRSIRAWTFMIRDSLIIARFTRARLVRARVRANADAFKIWALQHPRRVNAMQIMSSHNALGASPRGDAGVETPQPRQAEVEIADKVGAHEQHTGRFLESLMPVQLRPVCGTSSSDKGARHVYFIWKNVITHFEGRMTSRRNAKACGQAFDGWLAYQTTKSNLHRKKALFQLKWCLAPMTPTFMRWSAWSCACRCRRSILAKGLRQMKAALLLRVLDSWKDYRWRYLKYSRRTRVIEHKVFMQKMELLVEVTFQWWHECRKAKVLAVAEERLAKRTWRFRLRKAFLHFVIETGQRSNAALTMQPWTRSVIDQAAREHFAFNVIDATSEAARSSHLVQYTFVFWAQVSQRRAAILKRCQYRTHTRPLNRVFQTWSQFACFKRQMSSKFQRSLQRVIRNSLRSVLEFWQAYASICCILARRARNFLAAKHCRQCQNLLQFWRAYSASRLKLAQRAAKLVDLGEAKHAKTLSRNAIEYWNTYANVRVLVGARLERVFASRRERIKMAVVREWAHFTKHNRTVERFARHHEFAKMYRIWAAISKEKAKLARKGMQLMQQCEIRALRRAFTGMCHRMVAAEIAWQYRSSLRHIEVGSCSGHALRVWVKYVHQCRVQKSFQTTHSSRRLKVLLASAFREWWVRSRRIYKLRLVLRTVRLANRHNLRGILYRWRQRMRDKQIRTAQRAKAVAREAHFLCCTVFRAWGLHVSALVTDINFRMVAMEHDQLRDALSHWWKWGRWHRHQLDGRGTLHERRETKLLYEAFRVWCHFDLQRVRERRRKRLEAFVFGQHERITCTGGLGYKLTSRALGALKALVTARRHFSHVFERVRAIRDRNSQTCALLGWFEVAAHRRHCLMWLSRLSNKLLLRLLAAALYGWYWWGRQRRECDRSVLRADNYARRQRVALFQAGLRAWRNVAVQEQQLKGTYGRVVMRWKAGGIHRSLAAWKSVYFEAKIERAKSAKLERRRCARLLEACFEGWYVLGRLRMTSLARVCKAIAHKRVRLCRQTCFAWWHWYFERKGTHVHLVRIAGKRLRRCRQTTFAKWRMLKARSKDLEKNIVRCIASRLRRLRRLVLMDWHLHFVDNRNLMRARARTNDSRCWKLCVNALRAWSATLVSNRGTRRAYSNIRSTNGWKREGRALDAWLLHTRRKNHLHTASSNFRLNQDLRNKFSLYAEIFEALQEAVRKRRVHDMRVRQDALVARFDDFKNHSVMVFRNFRANHIAARLLQGWARFQKGQRHIRTRITQSRARRCLSGSFRTWYWLCHERHGKDHFSRIVVNEYMGVQRRKMHISFDCWLHAAGRTKAAQMMRERVIVRLVETIERRALLAWRAHTRGTLAVDTRPLELLVVLQQKRHSKALLAKGFDVLRARRRSAAYCRLVYIAHGTRTASRALFLKLREWRLWANFSSKTNAFFVLELRMRKVARITRGWNGVVCARGRLAFVVVKTRRRFLARVLQVWRTLLVRQDRVLDSFQHRFYYQQNKAAVRALARWSFEASRRRRLNALDLRFQKRQRLSVLRWWRASGLRRRQFVELLIHLKQRRRRSTLRRCFTGLRTLHKLRQAIRLVVGYMSASRSRRFAVRVLQSWQGHCGRAKVMLTAAVRIIASQQGRSKNLAFTYWLEATWTGKEEQVSNQQEDALYGALEAREHGLAELAKQLQMERENVARRDGWLENLGKELDKKDLRVKSMQEMLLAYEVELRGTQDVREREARLRDTVPLKGALEPRLQLSSRSARSCEKENEGPRGI